MSALDVDVRLTLGEFQLAAKFAVPAHGITCVFGPSGSGKSTLLSVLAGLKRCDGQIRLDVRTLADSVQNLYLPPHQREIGMVFQDARLFPHLTVRENIAYAWKRAPAATRPALEEVARFFDIHAFLDRPVGNLSGGEKSRVALARAVAAAPAFLLLDEPFAALDGARRRSFIQVLLRMHEAYKLPMMVVTHDVEDAATLASHLVAMKDGHVITCGDFAGASAQAAFRTLLDDRDLGVAMPAHVLRNLRGGQFVWLRADQVLLAAQRPQAISARNILEGEITSITKEVHGSLLVELSTAHGPILSRVTEEAVQELALTTGMRAWALVKAHTL
jgi:molybdate transport system ATP-binding protein